ncbi:hypothetical protein [Pseudonocardia sp. D17]|uniref:hypothetical protein n=1 Tax=Pseudonocardia sp. D17 TaxID=882661 RepID=UPI002B3E5582|nr:hypothetical protein PSD17_56580 [Pseudonocardia sp. D17]
MARIRQVKPDFFTSEAIAAIQPHRTRLTFVGLWTHADDNGRCRDNAKLIKAAVWPLDDDVTVADVEADLTELARLGRITRYQSDVGPLIAVTNFREHQHVNRRSKTTLPPPPGETDDDDPEPPPAATRPHTRRAARHAPVTPTEPVPHSGVPEHSVSTHGALTAHVATCGNNVIHGQFSEDSVSTHGALSEDSRPVWGMGYGYGYGGGGARDGVTAHADSGAAPAADAAPPRCRRHRDLPVDDPGPACVGCRSVRLARNRAAEAAERQRAEDARRGRIDAQLAARRADGPIASASGRQAAREAYRASQARKRGTA